MKRFQNFSFTKTLCTLVCVCIPFFAIAQDDDFEDDEKNEFQPSTHVKAQVVANQ